MRAGLVAIALALAATASAFGHEDPADRIADLTRRIWSQPGDAVLYLERAELRRLGGDAEGAGADLARARHLDPGLAAVDLCLGRLLAGQGRDAEARVALDRYLAQRPDDAAARVERARVLTRLGRPLDAARDWSVAIEHASQAAAPQPDWYLERARALASAGPASLRDARAGLAEGVRRLGRPVALLREAAILDAADAASREGSGGGADREGSDVSQRSEASSRATEAPATRRESTGAFDDAAPLVAETVLVQLDAPMRWLANASNPGIGITWTQQGFNDASWASGIYGVGYETTSGGAVHLLRTVVPSGSYSVYTRAHFTIPDLASVGNIFLGADYDDGVIAWINGVEVYRSGEMPAAPAWNTNASLHESSNGQTPNYAPLVNVSAAAFGALHAGDNVLAIGVWNSGAPSSSDLVLVPRLSINKAVALTRGPYLQMGTPAGIVVRWRTDTQTNSVVRYGDAPGNLSSSATVAAAVVDHEVSLQGLQPDTRYYYSVGSTSTVFAGEDEKYAFTTAPAPDAAEPRAARIWVIGDSGTADAGARAVRDAFTAFTGPVPADLWLMLGDNAYTTGTDAQYQAAVFDVYPDLLRTSVLWATLGNHDGASADSGTQTGPYYDIFTLPAAAQAGGVVSGTEAYYSFDHGNVHFICLDSFDSSRAPGGAMMIWLQDDLAAATKDWTIAFWHHPPYSKGSHDSDTEIELMEMRQNALPLLEAAGVDLVLSGHSHSYERSFLIDGHYGLSTTFLPSHKKNPGGGSPQTGGVYTKPQLGPDAHEGAVYAVAGSSGQISGGALDHPAMFASLNTLGSLVLDVRGNRLEAAFLDSAGAVEDRFTIVKGPELEPVADFAASPRSGPAPLLTGFVDRSTNGPTAWAWDFDEDGTTDSTATDPSRLFAAPGLRAVTLRASNGAGTGQRTRAGYVCVTAGAAAPEVVSLRVAPGAPAAISWSAQAAGTTYDVVTGDLLALAASAGDFTATLGACLAAGAPAASASDPRTPAPGQGFYYLARARDCAGQTGTYDEGGPGQVAPRDPEIAASVSACP